MSEIKIELPPEERGLTDHEAKRWDRLQGQLKRQDLTPRRREIAARSLEAMRKARAEVAERKWRGEALGETIALAEGRGDEIEVSKAGSLRSKAATVLQRLFVNGHLTAEQLETALTFKALYDARKDDAGAMDHTAERGAGHNNDQYVWTRVKRAKATQRVWKAEMAITLQCRDEPDALALFRGILGEDKSLRDFGGGREAARRAETFARTLDIAAET